MTTKQQSAPSSHVEALRAAMVAQPGARGQQLRAVIASLNSAKATEQERARQLREQTSAALLTSSDAYQKNLQGIEDAVREEQHLDALLEMARKELHSAQLMDDDHELREQGGEVLKQLRAAAKRSPEYEKLAAQIKAILTQHREAREAVTTFFARVNEMARQPERGAQWRASFEAEFYDASALAALELTNGGGMLFEEVQLPAVSTAEPFWGDKYGNIPPKERVRHEPQERREAGVYGPDGKRLHSTRHPVFQPVYGRETT